MPGRLVAHRGRVALDPRDRLSARRNRYSQPQSAPAETARAQLARTRCGVLRVKGGAPALPSASSAASPVSSHQRWLTYSYCLAPCDEDADGRLRGQYAEDVLVRR